MFKPGLARLFELKSQTRGKNMIRAKKMLFIYLNLYMNYTFISHLL